MIRQFDSADINHIMNIWLKATAKAHSFICEKYWNDNFAVVKNNYIPDSDTYVYEKNGKIYGFISIMQENFIGAVFVDTDMQSKGIGRALMDFAKEKYGSLKLNVYKKNGQAVNFYIKNGFTITQEQLDEKTGEDELVMQWAKN